MLYYFDTSAIVKIYHKEEGSETAITLFEDGRNKLPVSNNIYRI